MHKKPCAPMVGTDVEAFVYDGTTERYIPCVGLLPGTKDEPSPIKGLAKGFAVQEDNVMAEFNVPPTSSLRTFVTNLRVVQASIQELLPKNHYLRFESAVMFRPVDLMSDQAKQIGCDPDFDAYAGGEERTNKPKLDLWRTCGGHIHLGGDFRCPDFVAALFAEAFIGVMCGLNNNPFTSDRRAIWYGRPGIYRPKPYGIEYRTPSNIWANVMRSSSLASSVAGQAIRCAKWLTETDPLKLQQAFRLVRWPEVAAYMDGTHQQIQKPDDIGRTRNLVVKHLREAGVPI